MHNFWELMILFVLHHQNQQNDNYHYHWYHHYHKAKNTMKVGEGVNVNMSGPKKKERRPHVMWTRTTKEKFQKTEPESLDKNWITTPHCLWCWIVLGNSDVVIVKVVWVRNLDICIPVVGLLIPRESLISLFTRSWHTKIPNFYLLKVCIG